MRLHILQRIFWATCVVLAAVDLSTAQEFTRPVVINYNTKAETAYADNENGKTFSKAMAQCMANGMNLFSGESQSRIDRVFGLAKTVFTTGAGRSTYSSVSAKTTAGNTRCSFTRTPFFEPLNPVYPTIYDCFFTIQWGLFSAVTLAPEFGSQPGMYTYQCSYKYYSQSATDGTPSTNGCGGKSLYVDSFNWDEDNQVENPQGKSFTVIYTGAAETPIASRFANIDATAPADFYLPVSQFFTACEAQVNLGNHAETFTATQPLFVKGYKELTWVQEHWWVLFLIIAVIILIVLFAILIFCCMTSIPPKEGPPIAPMVLRERNGQAYVNASDDDSTPKSRGLNLDDANNASSMNGDGRQQPMGQQQMMMPVPVVDPEDLIQATPSIYSQEDVMQSAEGDSMASDEDDSNQSDEGQRH